MNVIEIMQAASHTVWSCAETIANLFSPELLCSTTFNLAILTATLLGAVRLVAVGDQGDRHATHQSGAERN